MLSHYFIYDLQLAMELNVLTSIHFYNTTVTPYLLYTRYSSLIEKVNIDGGGRTRVYSGGYPRALAFDFR